MTEAHYTLSLYDRDHRLVATQIFMPEDGVRVEFRHQLIMLGSSQVNYHPPKDEAAFDATDVTWSPP